MAKKGIKLKKVKQESKIEVPISLLEITELTKEVLITYVSIVHRGGKFAPKVDLMYKDIEEDTKMSYRTVKRAVEILEREGYILVSNIEGRVKTFSILKWILIALSHFTIFNINVII